MTNGLQVSPTPIPSPTCDQRAANSRRLGAAGTAVDTRLRACIIVLFGLLRELYSCNDATVLQRLACIWMHPLPFLLHVLCWPQITTLCSAAHTTMHSYVALQLCTAPAWTGLAVCQLLPPRSWKYVLALNSKYCYSSTVSSALT